MPVDVPIWAGKVTADLHPKRPLHRFEPERFSAYPPAVSENERAIRELVEKWMAATRVGDLLTVLDLISDDALFLTPGREPFGKEEFRAASEAMKGTAIDGRASVQEVEVVGDWAWLRNQINLTVITADGATFQRSGDTLTIFHKGQDGSWRLYRDANFVN